MTKRRPTGYNNTNYTEHWNCTVKENINTNLYRSNRYFYTAIYNVQFDLSVSQYAYFVETANID